MSSINITNHFFARVETNAVSRRQFAFETKHFYDFVNYVSKQKKNNWDDADDDDDVGYELISKRESIVIRYSHGSLWLPKCEWHFCGCHRKMRLKNRRRRFRSIINNSTERSRHSSFVMPYCRIANTQPLTRMSAASRLTYAAVSITTDHNK